MSVNGMNDHEMRLQKGTEEETIVEGIRLVRKDEKSVHVMVPLKSAERGIRRLSGDGKIVLVMRHQKGTAEETIAGRVHLLSGDGKIVLVMRLQRIAE